MQVTLCGVRGSIPTPDADKLRYGGNTSCVLLELEGGQLILDAGSGIRNLGARLFGRHEEVHILLTHLHLDHIMGLLFFAPLFDTEARGHRVGTAWGVSRSAPPAGALPVDAAVADRDARAARARELQGGPERALASCCGAGCRPRLSPIAARRSATASPRRATLCYLPDHEPALGIDLEQVPREWISGADLAAGADLLIHDAQYTRARVPRHDRLGPLDLRGHAALRGARRAERLLLFHHDPTHEDELLDRLLARAREVWVDRGGDAAQVDMAAEGTSLTL